MILLALIVACSQKEVPEETDIIDTSVEQEDTGDSDTSEDTSINEDINEDCIDVPIVTYASFGQGFITFNCQGCHASVSVDRQGAPDSVTFDDHQQVIQWLLRIYHRTYVTLDMPPALGVFEDLNDCASGLNVEGQ